MKDRLSIICLLLIGLTVIVSASGCGIRGMIKGQVVDAATGKPIEGAAVAVRWLKYEFGPPFSSGYKNIETEEDLTDINGFFRLPKYTGRKNFMGAYKKGYICWNSTSIFHPLGTTYEERIEKRKGHEIINGMVIRLEPFKTEYPKGRHATFTTNTGTRLSTSGVSVFDKAIKHETLLDIKRLRENNN